MKVISKILYGLISFSVFAAYKIEAAWAGWKVTLVSYKIGCTGGSTAEQIRTRLKNAITTLTICGKDEIFSGCFSGNGSLFSFPFHSPANIAEVCAKANPDYYGCTACPSGGRLLDDNPTTLLEVLGQGIEEFQTLTICDTETLTSRLNVLEYGKSEKDLPFNDMMLLAPLPNGATPMQQTYDFEFVHDETDWVSIGKNTNCYMAPGDEIYGESGVYVSDYDCPYLGASF